MNQPSEKGDRLFRAAAFRADNAKKERYTHARRTSRAAEPLPKTQFSS
jgi:hypothetical protein